MNEARVYAVRHRISEALSRDGPTVDSLASDADARVALLAGRIEAFVAGRVAVAGSAGVPRAGLRSGTEAR